MNKLFRLERILFAARPGVNKLHSLTGSFEFKHEKVSDCQHPATNINKLNHFQPFKIADIRLYSKKSKGKDEKVGSSNFYWIKISE